MDRPRQLLKLHYKIIHTVVLLFVADFTHIFNYIDTVYLEETDILKWLQVQMTLELVEDPLQRRVLMSIQEVTMTPEGD